MTVFILEFPLFLMLCQKGKKGFLVSLFLYIFMCTIIKVAQKGKTDNFFEIKYPVFSTLVCLGLTANFYFRWNHTWRMLYLASLCSLPYKQMCLIFASLLGIVGLFGIDYLLKMLFSLPGEKIKTLNRSAKNPSGSTDGVRTYLFIFLSAFLMISLNSQCSPLYPFNGWDDVNTIFTVGKSILKGLIPYKDLYEQKGPLLLFLQVPAALISFTSFLGLWIIEIIFAFFFLLLSYKTAKLFLGKKTLLIIPFLSFFVYNSTAFSHGGTAEEFCLPIIMFAIYKTCKSFINKTMLSNSDFLMIGITSACVFWIKYSMVGFYIGWYLFFFFFSIISGEFFSFLRQTLLIIAGFFITTVPVIIYFAANFSIEYLFDCYFYNNLVFYPNDKITFFNKVTQGLNNINEKNLIILLIVFIGAFWLDAIHLWKIFSLMTVSSIGLFLSIYSGGRSYEYYSLIISVFAVFGFCGIFDLVRRRKIFRIKYEPSRFSLCSILIFLFFFLMSLFSKNMFFLNQEKEDLMQHKIKSVLEEKGIFDPVVLSQPYGDSGIYTVMGNVPKIRFFCKYNNDKYEEIAEQHNEYLSEKEVDIIIYFSSQSNDFPEFENYVHIGCIEDYKNYTKGYYHLYMPEAS